MPGEIRNRIYREALVQPTSFSFYSPDYDEDDEYTIFEEQNTVEPGLLRCCTLIRSEALSIFLQENRFETTIQDYKMAPQRNHWFWLRLTPD